MTRWNIAANFFTGKQDRWLDDFIYDDVLEFVKITSVERHDWHAGGMRTGTIQWLQHMRHARAALRNDPYGVITCFPQLAFCVALFKTLRLTDVRIVAHNFNIGDVSGRGRGWLSGRILTAVDRFLVHSPFEVDQYAAWLRLPRDRFEFVPLQRGDSVIDAPEGGEEPYILAMGSAHRDYGTLLEAVGRLGLPTKIVCKRSIAEKLDVPENVEIRSDLSQQDCWKLLKGARLSVTPVSNLETASGQVTLIDAMRLRIPVLVTRCPGSEGYVEHLETGILLKPFDAEEMGEWIRRAWDDVALRDRLVGKAREFFERELSDEAAAERLRKILKQVASEDATPAEAAGRA